MRKLSELIRLSRFDNGSSPTDQSAERVGERQEMVPQDAHTQKRSHPRLRIITPLGFLGVAIALAVLSYTQFGAIAADLFSRDDRPDLTKVGVHSPIGDDSLAVVNPMNVGRAGNGANPVTVPVSEKTEGEGTPDNQSVQVVDPIGVVTPTILVSATIDASHPDATSEPAADNGQSNASGLVLTGQSQQVAGPSQQVTVDPEEITELLEPLLQDQVDPTPLVIELEIPTNGSTKESSGLGVTNLRVPSGSSALPQIVLLPTATPTREPDRQALMSVGVPVVEIVPAVGVKSTATPTPQPTPTPVPEPTALWSANGPQPGRPWSSFQPRPAESSDHFWVGNPFADVTANSLASPNYQFGSTAGGRYRPHHGVDISNPTGTPVRAGVAGEVIFAGPDTEEMLGPYNDFYGNAVVIRLDRRLPVAGGRLDVFVLYGHLSQVEATVGQRVEPDDVIGLVGMTGIAIGPHLHVEVRLGANTYSHNVNPYLWMEPPAGSGAVAVRVLTDDGKTWAGAKVSIARFQGGAAVWARQIETYLDTENIGPDPAWGENGAMGDVPAGFYYLVGQINGESIRAEFTVEAGQTAFVEVRTQQ